MSLAENFCLAMITFIIEHIMLRAILQFFLNDEFACSVDKYQPPQWRGNGFKVCLYRMRPRTQLGDVREGMV